MTRPRALSKYSAALLTSIAHQWRSNCANGNLLRIGKRLKVTIAFNYRQDDDGTLGTGDKRSRVSATRRMLTEREA